MTVPKFAFGDKENIMKILGFSSGSHDSSYCIMEDGVVIIHEELERITRIKECDGDPLKFFEDRGGNLEDFHYIVTFPHGDKKYYPPTMDKVQSLAKQGKVNFLMVGHHQSHAANAFHSSPFEDAIVITIDGGGWDFDPNNPSNMFASNFSFWVANKNTLTPISFSNSFNLGWAWSTLTKEVFNMSGGGPPYGCQAGTVMAMAAFGDSSKYYDSLKDVFWNHDYSKFKELTDQDQFDFASALQKHTEEFFFNIIEKCLSVYQTKNICISGGVALNCVMCGKIFDRFRGCNIYIPPVPYDSGLAIGCCQFVWHNILGNKNMRHAINSSPYIGNQYGELSVTDAIRTHDCVSQHITDDGVISMLNEGKIIAVYGGKSESGRRALGNRSILADPRPLDMKDKINEKVKHRKWFRPFAPSILREKVVDWFKHDIDSPYMSFAIQFKYGMGDKVPAVNHKDNTARLQTVSREDNEWYHSFISKWEKISGVPILLNTSFNDREPIVETPYDAIACFKKTDIDYLYFREFGLLVSKKK